MKNKYSKIPMDFRALIHGDEPEMCDIGASISQNLELIIQTQYCEHKSDPTYGTAIWEMNYDLLIREGQFELLLKNSFTEAIMIHEKRLHLKSVDTQVCETETLNKLRNFKEVKKQVHIIVEGQLVETNENYRFKTSIYLSPISSIN